MNSMWSHLKSEALKLRRQGYSLRDVEASLSIPRSTLSGWFRGVTLSTRNKAKLEKRGRESLVKARKAAVIWHNTQKRMRLEKAELEARNTLTLLDITDKNVTELALAMLYFGEGAKKGLKTALGSSDPMILRFFVHCLENIYLVPRDKIRCELHLRHDQNERNMIAYWTRELALSKKHFSKTSFDKRTKGRPTYPSYKGVCLISCGNVAIQRKLMYIARIFCNSLRNITKEGRLAQLVERPLDVR